MHIYCLFCRTQRCGAVADFYRRVHPKWTVIYPRLIQRKWVQGQKTDEIHALLPGYLFLYTDQPLDAKVLYQVDGVIRVLEQDGIAELNGADRRFAEFLLAHDGLLGNAPTYEEGQRIHLSKGYLAGFDGRIVRVDRQRERAQIEFTFDSAARKIWVGYDMMPADDRVGPKEDK